jgi:hypothetical protein
MTVAELKAELDRLGIEYPRKARKADLVALVERGAIAVNMSLVALEVGKAGAAAGKPPRLSDGMAWYPARLQNFRGKPPGKRSSLVRKEKPRGNPPGGGKWVFGPLPECLR